MWYIFIYVYMQNGILFSLLKEGILAGASGSQMES
jgi:hypothetical protein